MHLMCAELSGEVLVGGSGELLVFDPITYEPDAADPNYQRLVAIGAIELQDLDKALAYTSPYDEFIYFEDNKEPRAETTADFANYRVYTPNYTYKKLFAYAAGDSVATDPLMPELKVTYDDEGNEIVEVLIPDYNDPTEARKNNAYLGSIADEKTRLRVCMATISRHADTLGVDLTELYLDKLDVLFKKQLLLEAAAMIDMGQTAETRALGYKNFMKYNIELFGEFDEADFLSILATEKQLVASLDPKDENTKELKAELQEFLKAVPDAEPEPPLLDQETAEWYLQYLKEKFPYVFSVIPDTDESVKYDAQQSAEFMTEILKQSGLYEAGWRIVIDQNKSIVNTSAKNKQIQLPANTKRDAHGLRKLSLHEIMVHALRSHNGSLTGLMPLQYGTSNYADVEEGLGILLEVILDGGAAGGIAITRARDRMIAAGLALGADRAYVGRDASQTHELLWRFLALHQVKNGTLSDKDIAKAKHNPDVANSASTAHIDNAFRGTNFIAAGIAYIKLQVYRRGLLKSAQKLKELMGDYEAIDALFWAKLDHTDPVEVARVQELCKQLNPELSSL